MSKELEKIIINTPKFPINDGFRKFPPLKREEIWKNWADRFLCSYEQNCNSNEVDKQGLITLIIDRNPLELFHLFEGLSQANTENRNGTITEIADLIASRIKDASSKRSGFSKEEVELLGLIRHSKTISPEVKEKFK